MYAYKYLILHTYTYNNKYFVYIPYKMVICVLIRLLDNPFGRNPFVSVIVCDGMRKLLYKLLKYSFSLSLSNNK